MGVMKHIVGGVKRAMGLTRPGRRLRVLPDDIFLVSFPKSGNTWTRFLVANLVFPEQPVNFANIQQFVADPTGTSNKEFARMRRPRIIKSHDPFDGRYKRVIYVVRDPRDVVLSQYHYHRKLRKIPDDSPIELFVNRFLAGETCPHGSWGQNVITWLATRQGDPRFLLLRYEDMVADTARELGKIAAFLQLNISLEHMARAVERSSAGKMRKMEQAQTDNCDLTKGSRKDLMFVRAAKAGGWRSELPPPLVEKIEAAWAPIMRHLGYELTTRDASTVEELPLLALAGAVGVRG